MGAKMQQLFEYIFEKPDLKRLRNDIQQTILFKSLNPAELERVLKYTQLRTFKKGDHIFFEGDPGSALYIILKGNVNVVRHQRGKHTKIADLSKGMFFGELALVYEMPRSATAIVSDDTILACLFRHDLEKIIKENPRLGNKLLATISQILAQRLSSMIEKK